MYCSGRPGIDGSTYIHGKWGVFGLYQHQYRGLRLPICGSEDQPCGGGGRGDDPSWFTQADCHILVSTVQLQDSHADWQPQLPRPPQSHFGGLAKVLERPEMYGQIGRVARADPVSSAARLGRGLVESNIVYSVSTTDCMKYSWPRYSVPDPDLALNPLHLIISLFLNILWNWLGKITNRLHQRWNIQQWFKERC